MSITEYNGSGVVAMTGKNCVAIASDTRFGVQQQTIATDIPRIHKINKKTFLGLSGLLTDMQTIMSRFTFMNKLYELREEREMNCKTFANLVATTLYEKRFGPYFCEPVIAGLDEKNEPFINAQDLIGASEETNDFVVSGTSSDELFGVCEALYKPDMEPEDLFETISQCLLAAVDRDCLAGWGAEVVIITPKGITRRTLKARQD